MEAIFIQGTEDTPEVVLDHGTNKFSISNRSFPEDPFSFYKPIIEWLKVYINDAVDVTTFEFRLDYFNTSSSKQIFKLLLLLEKLSKNKTVSVNWYYSKEDTDMLSSGEIFSKLVNINFNIIEE